MKKNILLYIFLLLGVSGLYGQDCTGYHQYHCTYADYTFFYSRQSKSALFKRGQTSTMKIIAYGGEDYYVSVCAHRKFGDIEFKLLEDNEEKTLIYDNTKDDYAQSVIFSNETTRNLIIEVTVPPGKQNENDKRCVGVIIQFKKNEE